VSEGKCPTGRDGMIAGVASSRCQSPRRYRIVTEGSFVKTERPMRVHGAFCCSALQVAPTGELPLPRWSTWSCPSHITCNCR
jgi:hypothetical protein